MKKRLNDRGIAMELAIITLLTIFGLCLILLTVAQLTANTSAKTTNAVKARIELDEIADTFVANGENFRPTAYRDHNVTVEPLRNGGTRMTAKRTSAPDTSITVEVNDGGEITRWSYD